MLVFSLRHRWASALLLGTAALAAHAQDWQAPNPYRTTEPARLAQLQADGRAAYTQHCARCHGADAVRPMAEAPDLRRLNSVCVRLKNEALARRCQQDVDAYFSQSVQEGKVRAGIEHMPAWRDTLAPGTAWAIQLFIEGQPKPLPRTQTRVDTAQGH